MPPADSAQAAWFREHIQPHEAMLRAWLRNRFPRQTDLDDVVQEAFARVMQAHERAAIASPKAFLFATARNFVLTQMRHQHSGRADISLAEGDAGSVLDESADVQQEVSHAQELELLTEAIQSLPTRCRQVITLRKIYGVTQKEIAELLGIAEHTVEAQVTIGLRKLAEYFQRMDAPTRPRRGQ